MHSSRPSLLLHMYLGEDREYLMLTELGSEGWATSLNAIGKSIDQLHSVPIVAKFVARWPHRARLYSMEKVGMDNHDTSTCPA